MSKTYWEYRGVEHAVYAEITKDDSTGYTTGEVKDLTGVSEISKSVDVSSETHFYDNLPAIVIQGNGADTITLATSGIPMEVVAELTGQTYDAATGMLIEQEQKTKYFALGYKTAKTDGTVVYVWRLKGTFALGDMTHATKDDGTDANGQELTYTGISTTKKFTKGNGPAKAVNVDTSVNVNMDDETFFETVLTPDTVTAPAA